MLTVVAILGVSALVSAEVRAGAGECLSVGQEPASPQVPNSTNRLICVPVNEGIAFALEAASFGRVCRLRGNPWDERSMRLHDLSEADDE